MSLNRDEKIALLNWASDLSQDSLDLFLFKAIDVRASAFSSDRQPMPTIAMNLVGFVDVRSSIALALFQAIAKEYPQHESTPVLAGAATRIAAIERKQGGASPWDAYLINGVPIADRGALRRRLSDIVGGQSDDVAFSIDGPGGSGRTRSWHLIEHVALKTQQYRPLKVDILDPPVQDGGAAYIFDRLAQAFALPASVRIPTVTGATPETIAERFVHVLKDAVDLSPPQKPVWVVFDSIDRPAPQDVKPFIGQLASLWLRHPSPHYRMFLLGSDIGMSISDPNRLHIRENLTAFLPDEIAEAAAALNALGNSPLAQDVLAYRVQAMCALLGSGSDREVCNGIGNALLALRDEVRR